MKLKILDVNISLKVFFEISIFVKPFNLSQLIHLVLKITRLQFAIIVPQEVKIMDKLALNES